MKMFYAILIIFIISFQHSYSWGKGQLFDFHHLLNPYNDKEIIFICELGNSEKPFYLISLDILNGKSYFLNLKANSQNSVTGAIINGRSKQIAYFDGNNIVVYNYITKKEITEFSTPYDLKNDSIKKSFSKNGDLLYVFNKTELKLIVYKVTTGLKVKEIIINSNPIFYFDAFLNSDKDEFALGINDSLEFRSIETEAILRKIPFNSKAEKIQFRSDGEKISYLLNSKEIVFINSLTGQELYHKTSTENIEYFEFSARMNYLISLDINNLQSIYDIQADTLMQYENIKTKYNQPVPFQYINSDNSKAIGWDTEDFDCPAFASMPFLAAVYYLFDLQDYKKTVTIPEGYLKYPNYSIINNQNNLVAFFIHTYFGNDSLIKGALLSGSGDFIKYLKVPGLPIAFTAESDYIALTDSNKIHFYNYNTETVEKTLTTNRENISYLDFVNSDKRKIIIYYSGFYNAYIEVYDYDDFSLKFTIDLKSEGINLLNIKCDMDGNVRFCSEKEVCTLDLVTGKYSKTELLNIPANFIYCSTTNDMKYFLFRNEKDSAFVYDVQKQNIKYTYKIEGLTVNSYGLSLDFLGNHQHIIISYISDYYYKTEISYGYDLENNEKFYFSGDSFPIQSKDGKFYAFTRCPTYYGFVGIPNAVSVEADKINLAELRINPNPSTDYIEIRITNQNVITLNHNYQIYNVLGTDMTGLCNTESGNNNDVIRINVSHLNSGVYFIKAGEKVEKFVKI